MSLSTSRSRRQVGLLAAATAAVTLLSVVPLATVHAAKSVPTSLNVVGSDIDFKPTIQDYVLYNCANKTVTLKVANPSGRDRLNGKLMAGKIKTEKRIPTRTINVAMKADQVLHFSFAANTTISGSEVAGRYYVRCLPDDFPVLKTSVTDSDAMPNGYYLMPYYSRSLQGQTFASNYYIIMNRYGTPIWYNRAQGGSTVLLPDYNGNILTLGVPNGVSPGTVRSENALQLSDLSGKIIASYKPSDPVVRPVQRLANGNFLFITGPERTGVDFTNLSTKFKSTECDITNRSNVTVIGVKVVEMTPSGQVIWDWEGTDHIGFQEPSQASMVDAALPGEPKRCVLDLFHANGISKDQNNGGYTLSLRWSGLYHIDAASKTISWKLGGSKRADSLTVQGDPLGVAGPVAQHGGYLSADSTLLVFDNQVANHVLARGVSYYIDPAARTATFSRSYNLGSDFCVDTDGSLFCATSSQGAATYINPGTVLISWGNTAGRNQLATVFHRDGTPILTISSTSPKPNVFATYYAAPEAFNIDKLRNAASSNITVPAGQYKR